MQLNKTTTALVSVGVLIGTAAVMGIQTHAQQATTPAPQIQNQVVQTPAQPTTDKVIPQDTDNIQDPGGIEKPDAPDAATQAKGTDQETNDQGSDKDTAPDNGKSDQGETDTNSTTVTK